MQGHTKVKIVRWFMMILFACMFAVVLSILVASFIVNDPAMFPLTTTMLALLGAWLIGCLHIPAI